MSNFLRNGNITSIANQKAKETRKAINERWERFGFLKGMKGYLKENMATIFENQATSLTEATDASNSGSFETVVFPLVRRVFSSLLANDIVSVQAMNLPIGKLFFIKPVTSERIPVGDDPTNPEGLRHAGLMGYKRGERNDIEGRNRYYLPDEVVNDPDSPVTTYQSKSLYDLFYNDGLFDHSKGRAHIVTANEIVGGVVFDEKGHLKDGIGIEDLLAKDGSLRNLIIEVRGFSETVAGKLVGPDGNEMDTEEFIASLKIVANDAITSDADGATFKQGESIPFRFVTQQYGKALVGKYVDASKHAILLELDFTKPAKPGVSFDGRIGITQNTIDLGAIIDSLKAAWMRYDSLELETEIGEVSFELSEVVVSVTERKLRATWSPEMAQDVAAFHNIDAEAELTAILSEQIAAEIDREILRDLRKGAPWTLRWDYNGWRRLQTFSTNYTQKDWNQMFMTHINQVSNQIHKATLRGGANYVVVSTELSAVLQDLEYFHVTDANAESTTYAMGIEKIGSLNGRYQVYVDPYSPKESCILGHKGDSLLDTGYIYAPYVPMQLTPTIPNPHNFAPVKGIITRYAKKMVNNRYFGAILVDGLISWNINELR